MQINDEQINKFQVLYKKHFGEDITKEDVLNQGRKIVRLVEVVLKQKAKMFTKESVKNKI